MFVFFSFWRGLFYGWAFAEVFLLGLFLKPFVLAFFRGLFVEAFWRFFRGFWRLFERFNLKIFVDFDTFFYFF